MEAWIRLKQVNVQVELDYTLCTAVRVKPTELSLSGSVSVSADGSLDKIDTM